MTTKFKADDLNYRYIRAKTHSYDWSKGYGEEWEIQLPDTNSMRKKECKEWLREYGIAYAKGETKSNLRDQVDDAFQENIHDFEPMMNYYIDLDEDVNKAGDIASKMVGECFTVVIIDGDTVGLALAGGGMDMTWQIIRAFAALGSLPPVDYCNVPGMAGEDDQEVIKAANRTLQTLINEHQRSIKHNEDLI